MMKFKQLGWIFSAVFASVLITGFQAGGDKVGVVNIGKMFNESEAFKKQSSSLKAAGQSRQAVMEFIDTYRTFTPEQSSRFKELSVKETLTAAEKTELEKIKTDVMAADKEFKALQTKSSPTDAEVTKLQDYNKRMQTMSATAQRWNREFEVELTEIQGKYRQATIEQAKQAVKEVGSKGSYTVIFTTETAPYGANDVTDAALKAMNARK